MAVMIMPNSRSPPRGITCNFKSVIRLLSLSCSVGVRACQAPIPGGMSSFFSGFPGFPGFLALVSIRPPAPGSGLPCELWKICGKSVPPCAPSLIPRNAEKLRTRRAHPAWRSARPESAVGHRACKPAPRRTSATRHRRDPPRPRNVCPPSDRTHSADGRSRSCQALHRRGFDPGPVAKRVDLAKSNVLTNKQVIAHVILEDDADFAAQILHVALAQVDSVQQKLPFGGVVEPCQKLDQGRFSGSVLTN